MGESIVQANHSSVRNGKTNSCTPARNTSTAATARRRRTAGVGAASARDRSATGYVRTSTADGTSLR
jgi:pyruvoyl-dependent arginine decarboxylase (PvlArgDC)